MLLEDARGLLEGGTAASTRRFARAVAALTPAELLAFDADARGLPAEAIARLRWPNGRGGRRELWALLGLCSADAAERERAARAGDLSPVAVRLLALRCAEAGAGVRAAALERLEDAPPALLLEALAVAEELRAAPLDALLADRLAPGDLRAAAASQDPLTRRAAKRRLAERGAT